MKTRLTDLFRFAPDDGAGAGAGAPPPPPPPPGEEKQKDPPAPPAEGAEKKEEKPAEGKKGILSATPKEKSGDTQPPKGEKAADDAPIEVKLPEGVTLDKALLEKAMPVFKELKLNSEGATKLATLLVEHQKGEQAQWDAQHETWGKELAADGEFGGKNLDVSTAAAQKAVLEFGGPELAADLDKFGMSNMPSLARAFAKVGKAMAEDTFRAPRAPDVAPPPTKNEKLAKEFPSLAKALGVGDQ